MTTAGSSMRGGPRRRRLTRAVLLTPVVLTVAVATGVVLGLRTGNPRVRRGTRRLNRAVINPRYLRTAGRAGERHSVVRHRGRRTGRPHETPVGATRSEDGFVVPLPYGPGTDWVRNLQAAGVGSVVHDGREHPVTSPQVVPIADVLQRFGRSEQVGIRIVGIREALVVRDDAAVGAP